jgi:hypothetical protein
MSTMELLKGHLIFMSIFSLTQLQIRQEKFNGPAVSALDRRT